MSALSLSLTAAAGRAQRPVRMVSLTQATESFETVTRAANALVGIAVQRGDANGQLRRWDDTWRRTLSDLRGTLDASCSSPDLRADCEARAVNALACDLVVEINVARSAALVDEERQAEWSTLTQSLGARRRLADAALQRGAVGLSCEDLPGVWAVYCEDPAHPLLANEREVLRLARSASPRPAATSSRVDGTSSMDSLVRDQARTLMSRLYGSVSEVAAVARNVESMGSEGSTDGASLGAGLALLSVAPAAVSRFGAIEAEIRSVEDDACLSSDATVRVLLCGIGFDLARARADTDRARRASAVGDRDRGARRAWERLLLVLQARFSFRPPASVAVEDPIPERSHDADGAAQPTVLATTE